jgi:hypothetical protein
MMMTMMMIIIIIIIITETVRLGSGFAVQQWALL